MAQEVQLVAYKHQGLSLISRTLALKVRQITHFQSWLMVMVETGGSLGLAGTLRAPVLR